LNELVQERKEMLKRIVDQNALEFVNPSPPADAAADAAASEEREPE